MATQKQIEANRLNAQRSTRARSNEGKAIIRMNAKRDGFTGQVNTLSDEDRPIFEKFKLDFIKDLAPKTTLELSLATSIAWDTWRLNHLRAVEMNMYAIGEDPANAVDCGDNPKNPNSHGSGHDLRQRSAQARPDEHLRAAHESQHPQEPGHSPRYSDIKGLTYQAPSAPTLNGSVFSNREIFAAVNRLTTLKVAKIALGKEPTRVQYAGAASSAPSNVVDWPKEPNAA